MSIITADRNDNKVTINEDIVHIKTIATLPASLNSLADVTVTTPINGQTLQYSSSTGKWINATAGSGDMLKAVYDPTNVNSSAFDIDNMIESATNKILTATERANIITNNSKISFDSTSSTKLATIATGAEVNVQSDWDATTGDALILNKPSIPSAAPVDSVNGETGVVVLTTGDLTEDTNKKYVTDAEKVVLGNTSGTNTGDQIISDATITTTDITTNNVSTSKHGFAPKGDGSASKFLNANGVYSTPAGTGDVIGPTSAVDENIAVFNGTTGKIIEDAGINKSAITANTAKISYTDAATVALNTTHRTSDGTDHTFINQDVTTTSSPTFAGTNFTDISADDVNVTDTNDYYDGTEVESILDEIGETRLISGFDLLDTNSNPDIAFVNGTRTFTASVKSGQSSFHFWVNNHKYTKTTDQTVVIPDTTGTYYIVFNNSGTLISVAEASVSSETFYENAIVGLVYWNTTASTSMVGNEIHGINMSGRSHHYNHATYGARYESGLDITGLEDGEIDYTNTTSGFFWDEDIRHSLALQTTHPFIYKLGATGEWTGTTPDSLVGFKNGTSNVVFNEWTGTTWQLTESGSQTDYIIYFTIATPDINGYNVKKIIGQNGYSSRSKARAAIEDEIDAIVMDGLPSPEFIFLQAFIVRRNGDLENLADGSTHLDLRAIKGGTAGTSGSTSIAADVTTDVTNFNTHLSATDNNVQTALETLDDHTHIASQITDFDTEVTNNSNVVANTAKVTNATHTGEVTGDEALTVDKTVITGKTTVTVDNADFVLVSDTSDSGNLKKVLASDFGGGGGSGDVVGPSSSTDEGIARFDGTTGKLIQDSPITISDAGTLTFTPTANMTCIDISANNLDLTWKLGHGNDDYGHYWLYEGSGTGDANYLYQYVENGVGTDFWHVRYHQTTHVIDIDSNILPLTTNTRTLGDSTHVYSAVYSTEFHGGGSNITGLTASNISDFDTEVANNSTVTSNTSFRTTPSTVITAGTNLTWSGNTLNASGTGTSPLTTKGDLYVYSTTDARLPVGTNDYVLTADSSETTGVKWAPASAGGDLNIDGGNSSSVYTAPQSIDGGDSS